MKEKSTKKTTSTAGKTLTATTGQYDSPAVLDYYGAKLEGLLSRYGKKIIEYYAVFFVRTLLGLCFLEQTF